ncbi:hypothetical protein PFISCL1PPCAC_7857, partial [Pristionchus fissidentatus]
EGRSDSDDIYEHCFAFLKLHPYTYKTTRVVMESFDGSNTVTLKNENGIVLLECKRENEKVKAFLGGALVMETENPSTQHLYCEFDADLSKTQAMLGQATYASSMSIASVILATEHKATLTYTPSTTVYCSPTVLVGPHDAFAEDKNYAKARYELGRVVCSQSKIFTTTEYRPDGSEEYERIQKIKCENSHYVKYAIDNTAQDIALDDDIDVRCVADADYFCDYDLKYTPNEKALNRIKPDADTPVKGSIQCPASHPFFVIRGQRPIIHPEKITCKNHGGKMRWTYGKMILSSTSPEVHCVNKLECHVMNKMQKSNLQGSFMNEQFLPTCQEGGKLTVKEGKEENDVIDVTCNEQTGVYNYKYHSNNGDVERSVSKTTVFKCTYKVELAPNAASHKWFIAAGSGSAIVSLIAAAVVTWIVVVKRRRKAKEYDIGLQKNRDNVAQISDRMEKNVEVARKLGVRRDAEGDLLANDYLQMMLKAAKTEVPHEVIKKQVIANRNRVMTKVTKKFHENLGLRYTEHRTFSPFAPELGDMRRKLEKKIRAE